MNKETLAYIIGVSIGDGNLSNPNGRAVRLRISCDSQYPNLIKKISQSLQQIFPNNRVSFHFRKKKTCGDISCYSNKLPEILGWKPGPKTTQNICVPDWILSDKDYMKACLLGLLETDGSIYKDRGYTTILFTSIIKQISQEVFFIIKKLGFEPKFYKIQEKNKKNARYNVRLTKQVDKFLELIPFSKS